MRAWGDNEYGQSDVPAGLSNVVAIAAGNLHSAALQADGTIVTWGRYNEGASAAGSRAGNGVAIAAGPNHDLVITRSGDLLVWGMTFGSGVTNLPVPADLTNCVAIAAGRDYSLAIRQDGTAEGWGSPGNNYGQTTVPQGLSNVVAVAGGGIHSVALAPNEPPVALPQTVSGGINQDLPVTLTATDFEGDTVRLCITVLPLSGALYQYVNGARGAQITQANTWLPNGAVRVIFVPAPEAFGKPYASFAFVANDGLADSAPATITINIIGPTAAATQLPGPIRPTLATLNGMAVAGNLPATAWFEWGATRGYGQSTGPQAIPASANVLRVSATVSNLAAKGIYHCRLVVANAGGTAYGSDQTFTTGRKVTPWGGSDYYGELNIPPGLSNTVAIAAGFSHSLALDAQGGVSAWGPNYYGEASVPPGLGGVMAIAARSEYSLALREDGTVAAWGYGVNGETNVPAGLSNVVAIAAGDSHDLALRADGTVAVWGAYSQTNILATNNNVVAIAAGLNRSILLKADGTVFEWPVIFPMPAVVNDVIAIAAGDLHTLAIKSDGTVMAWGWNSDGQTNVPPGLSNVIAIAASGTTSLALKEDGTIVGWGYNYYGQAQAPDGLSFAAGIASGDTHSLALANAPAQAHAQTNYGAAEHDLAISLKGTDPNKDPLSFQISALPSAGSLFQYTPSGHGAAITAPNTPVTDAAGRVIFTPAPGGRGNPYATFGYAVGDGEAPVSAPATVTLGLMDKPYAATRPAMAVTRSGATLNGSVVPNAYPTTAWFEWGPNAALGQRTPPIDMGSGNGLQIPSALLTGLSSNSVYCFRLVVSNALGVTTAATRQFTTGSKAAIWAYPSSIQDGLGELTSVAVGTEHYLVLRPDGSVGDSGPGYFDPARASNVLSVAAAGSNCLALRADGTVLAWGDNSYGQADVPLELTNVVGIACGEMHNLALRSDGTVTAWGNNDARQCNVPADLNNVVELAAGTRFSVALIADGTVRLWGDGIVPFSPPGPSNVVALAAGNLHALALKADGTVSAWGFSYTGADIVPPGLSNVVAIAASGSNSMALRFNGTVVAWGDNSRSQTNVPAAFTNVSAIAIGGMQPMALRANSPPSATPQAITALANQDTPIYLLTSDPDYDLLSVRIVALPVEGSLYQFVNGARGAPITDTNTTVSDYFYRIIYAPATNGYGVSYDSFSFLASDGEAESVPAAVTISVPAPLYAASQRPGSVTTTSADLNGMVFASGLPTLTWFEWGSVGVYSGATGPTLVAGGAKLTRLTASLSGLVPNNVYHYRLVATNATGVVRGAEQRFRTGGKVATWGAGPTNPPAGLSNVVSVAAGLTMNLALLADGTVRSWGSSPTVPAGLTNVIAVDAGEYHGVSVRANGTVVAWGGLYPYPLLTNVPANLSNVVAIACGDMHTLALRSDGTIVPWGYGYAVQSMPYGLINAVAVAAGSRHSLALLMDGTVTAWGDNSGGQRNVPAGLTNVVAVAGGFHHSLALKSDGRVVAWGDNSYAQTNVPADLTNVVAIAAGDTDSVALRGDGTVIVWGSNAMGQTNVPGALAGVTEVASDDDHLLALGSNLPPGAQNVQVSGYPNHDATITLKGTDPNGDSLHYRFVSLPDHGALYQYTSGVRGASIQNTGTAVVDASSRVIFAPARNDYGSPCAAFRFVANDGETDSLPAIVSVIISAPVNPTITSFGYGTNGAYGLTFEGDSNTSYCVWASTDLLTWEYLGPAAQTTPGVFSFSDPSANNLPRRFYRVSTGCLAPAAQYYGYSRSPDGTFEMRFTGSPNSAYRVWASTNLTDWQMLGMATETEAGLFRFLDSSAANWPQRFYRVGTP